MSFAAIPGRAGRMCPENAQLIHHEGSDREDLGHSQNRRGFPSSPQLGERWTNRWNPRDTRGYTPSRNPPAGYTRHSGTQKRPPERYPRVAGTGTIDETNRESPNWDP
ncbi:hypothetical protein PCANC_23950 [Puccinia coronata f. sp. avenae]|uniref:Uncharacterized protein n=1 Tax=Puccinia coronata f. sp. avenae TaxID=200324 RepID=A0A2N5S3Y1_9BASI|nr:hypothetical protein PCANC_23950 [Puccinia coronata f. sp. avenae]